jgi:hypothetical protein
MSDFPSQNHLAQTAARNAPQQKTPPPEAAIGRDVKGRFTKGNPGGPGNPFARRTAAARKAFCEAVSHQDLVEIARALKDRARGGDVAAARLVLAYVVGKPADVVEPDTLDLQEFQQYEEQVRRYGSLPSVAATPDLGLACTIARASRPGIADTAARDLGRALVEGDFPEDSPFADPDDFECQEVSGSDTPPSLIGSIGAPEALAPAAAEVAGKLPGSGAGEQGVAAGQPQHEVSVPLAELAKLLPPETVVRLTFGGANPPATPQAAPRQRPSPSREIGGNPGDSARPRGGMPW